MTSGFQQRHDKALVTLAVGEGYVRGFLSRAEPTWRAYCERHGYDLVLLTQPIDPSWDPSAKSIHWQKMLIGLLPQLRTYERLVWVDGDILINHRLAPCIVSASDPEKIGVVDISEPFRRPDQVFNLHARYLILNFLMNRAGNPGMEPCVITDGDLKAYYARFGLRGAAERFINTGVLVFSPERHNAFLSETYVKYARDFADFENTPLSFEIQEAGLADYLDGRFNAIWAQTLAEHYPFLFDVGLIETRPELFRACVNVAFQNAWFLHFAGSGRHPVIKTAFDLVDPSIEGVPEMVFPELWAQRDQLLTFVGLEGLRENLIAAGKGEGRYKVLY